MSIVDWLFISHLSSSSIQNESPHIHKSSLDGRVPFDLSATVVSIVFRNTMRFRWYTPDRVRVLKNGTLHLQ